MSPIRDTRFAASRAKLRDDELKSSRFADRMEYLRPALILGLGLAVVLLTIMLRGPTSSNDPHIAAIALIYLIKLAIELVIGVAGLWIAASLWLGGVGYLGLAILRLAACYAAADAVYELLSSVPIFNWGASIAVYLGLLIWLFELEVQDAIILAVITWLLKLVAGFAIMSLLMSVL